MLKERENSVRELKQRLNDQIRKVTESKEGSEIVTKSLEVFDRVYKGNNASAKKQQ